MSKITKKNKAFGKFAWGGTSPFFYHPFISFFTPTLKNKTMLDVGCGRGTYGFLTRTTRDCRQAKLIGIEPNETYLKFCRKHKIYDRLIKHHIPTIPLKDKSVDFLLCSEVIEHLEKKDGEKFLDEMDRVCEGRIVITTPNIYFHTIPGEHEDDHHSLWSVSDFRERGYKVYGLGLKTTLLPGDRFLNIRRALYFLFTPMSYLIPEIGGVLVCVKDF